MSEETLQYPAKIAKELGISANKINALKKQGCPFLGRKTSVKLVRSFLYRTMGVESFPEPPARLQRLDGSRVD